MGNGKWEKGCEDGGLGRWGMRKNGEWERDGRWEGNEGGGIQLGRFGRGSMGNDD
jgi:hypothetical protein